MLAEERLRALSGTTVRSIYTWYIYKVYMYIYSRLVLAEYQFFTRGNMMSR